MNSTPVLVAPRPVRITTDSAPLFFHTHNLCHSQSSPRLRTVPLASITERTELSAATVSPSSAVAGFTRQESSQSPRLSPKEEALEEFLSIFRSTAAGSTSPPPSFLFSPSPNRIRALCSYRQQANTLFALEEVASWSNGNMSSAPDAEREEPLVRPESGSGSNVEIKPHALCFSSSHLCKSSLFTSSSPSWVCLDPPVDYIDPFPASPISRTHTRNPFQRHPSYDIVILSTSESPRPSAGDTASACVSPANIPLPPTPEMRLEHI